MSIVEPNQPFPRWAVQRKRVPQSVWSGSVRHHPLDLEFQPVAFFQEMNTTIESKQELQSMIVHIH